MHLSPTSKLGYMSFKTHYEQDTLASHERLSKTMYTDLTET